MSEFIINSGMKTARIIFKVIFSFALLALTIFGQVKTETDIRPLTIEKPIERELKGDEAHSYSLALQAGQFLNVVVEQKGVDVVVALFDSTNKKIVVVDSPNGTQGPEVITYITEADGKYMIEVRSLEKNAADGKYNIRVASLRQATEQDRIKIRSDAIYSEAVGLFQQGTAVSFQASILKFEEARRLFKDLDDKELEANTLVYIGFIYDSLGEKQKALEYYNQSLLLCRIIGAKNGEVSVLNNIGKVYRNLGENQKALEYFNQSLSLNRVVGDKGGEVVILDNIGGVYNVLGENQKALEYFNQSLSLSRIIGDKLGEARTLNNISNFYSDLGEKEKVLEYLNQSLPLLRAIGNKGGEAAVLGNIGAVYGDLGENQKALQYFNQSLSLNRVVGDKGGEALMLNNIGTSYRNLGENRKAIEYYNQSLSLSRIIGDKSLEAKTLNNFGVFYRNLGENQKALEYYNRSLPLFRAIGDKSGEALTLNYLSYIWKMAGNPRFGIFYGKQSVNNFQILRSNVQGLDKNLQQTFLKSIENTYRRLADVLVNQQRYAEAQQILNAFKDQQFFDFSHNKQLAPLAATVRETEMTATFNQKLENVVAAIRALDGFKRNIGNRPPTADETTQLKSFADKQTAANDDYLAFLKSAEKDFAAPPDEKDKFPDVADLREMQNALRETSAATKQNTVAIYTLVGDENFHALVITFDSIKAISTSIKKDVFNEKAKRFWALLQSDKYDTTKLGKEIYDTVFKPIEKELPKGTKTILWSLDGNLRYVPMAALYDGKKYLVERYNHVNFTRADKEGMTRAVSPNWTGTGFGSTKAQTVSLLGESISFNPLPGVDEELAAIFKQADSKSGILDGAVLPDAKFTKPAMLDALKQKRPLVHIASHFSFRPGDESRSFLLLGDGTAFTLEEMKKQTDLFGGVELLTLSACNTAANQADANGREVDAFAELAQRLGASAVMATLWSVADNSTPWLMREFYDLKLGKKMTKAEALRQAQLDLLKGKAETKPLATRTDSSPVKIVIGEAPTDKTPTVNTRTDIVYFGKEDAPLFIADKTKPFAHPYFWSPFVLIGNWR